MQVQKEWLNFLREQYPKGSRIRLTEMKDDPYALSPGSMGTLEHIDDAGQFHVKWDNGSGLALIIGEDRFQVQLPEPQTLKFYMPITAQLYGRDSWGDLEEYGNDLNGRDLRDYHGRAQCLHCGLDRLFWCGDRSGASVRAVQHCRRNHVADFPALQNRRLCGFRKLRRNGYRDQYLLYHHAYRG